MAVFGHITRSDGLSWVLLAVLGYI
jgi:hypothetical protein